MSDPQLDLTVRAVVARQLRLPPDDLTADLDVVHELGVSGGGERQLICAIGEALDVSFPDDLLDGVETYADLTSVVRVSVGPLPSTSGRDARSATPGRQRGK